MGLPRKRGSFLSAEGGESAECAILSQRKANDKSIFEIKNVGGVGYELTNFKYFLRNWDYFLKVL